MSTGQPERRKYPRFVAGSQASARIAPVFQASVLNISLGGVLVEHMHPIRPGTPSSVTLNLDGRDITLQCRSVRSAVHRLEVQPDGERRLIYHSALEFLESPETTHQTIGGYLKALSSSHR